MHWISAGVGGERGTRGKDGFPQELQQRSGSQERQDVLDQCRSRRGSRNQGKDGFPKELQQMSCSQERQDALNNFSPTLSEIWAKI